jgi:hypothetical protein
VEYARGQLRPALPACRRGRGHVPGARRGQNFEPRRRDGRGARAAARAKAVFRGAERGEERALLVLLADGALLRGDVQPWEIKKSIRTDTNLQFYEENEREEETLERKKHGARTRFK